MSSIAEYMGPVARRLLNAWSALPKRDLVPDRQSFDPMAIAGILPVVSLVERAGEEQWRFRLAGTELDRRWGRPLTGADYFTVVSAEAAAVVRREFAGIVEQPCGSWSIRCIEYESGRRVGMEALRLPLRARDGRLGLILSCSGDLSGRSAGLTERPRMIVRVTRQRFIDVGAGLPSDNALGATAQAGG
ncbi:MAG TPA: PAS domain-containing protein [Stellaceae bacterium]|nr:PAS domain-containing protein [Stellaceae bacterium]